MIKKEKGVTLISLIITIAIMTILTSTVVYISMDRFEINNLRKMKNDIELLQDKISSYYLIYGVLPILRDVNNVKIKYNSNITFPTNNADNLNYYIIDLDAMEGLALNYGKTGFEKPNTSNDVYVINEKSHIIYYVKGVEMDGVKYYSKDSNYNVYTDNIPPSKPEINIISGEKNKEGIYITNVEIEIVPGKDNVSGVGGTLYTLNNGNSWEGLGNTAKVITLTQNKTYIIRAKSYDNAGSPNYSAEATITIQISK